MSKASGIKEHILYYFTDVLSDEEYKALEKKLAEYEEAVKADAKHEFDEFLKQACGKCIR